MPSQKPDRKEIEALRRKRKLFAANNSDDLFCDLHAECVHAVADGCITPESSLSLLKFLESRPKIAAIYPNNVLLNTLKACCSEGVWPPEIEHDVLVFICSLYLGYELNKGNKVGIVLSAQFHESDFTITTEPAKANPTPPEDLSFVLSSTQFENSRFKDALFSDYMDSMDQPPDLKDCFVGFSGKFHFGSRAKCFANARQRGAVPCEPAWYMDYLFISCELEKQGYISSKIDSAIYFRRLYGKPLILSEHVWNSVCGMS